MKCVILPLHKSQVPRSNFNLTTCKPNRIFSCIFSFSPQKTITQLSLLPNHNPYDLLFTNLFIMDLQEVGGGCGDWMELVQDRESWWALVSMVMNFQIP